MFGLKTCILSDEAQIRTIKTKTETGTEIETETDTDTETKSGAKRVITLITDDVESQKKVPVVVQLQLCETRRGTPITPLKFSSTEISAVLDISDTFVSFLRKAWRVDKKLYALQDVVVEYERTQSMNDTQSGRPQVSTNLCFARGFGTTFISSGLYPQFFVRYGSMRKGIKTSSCSHQ